MQWKNQKPPMFFVINEGGTPGKFYRWIYGREQVLPYYDLVKQVPLDDMKALGFSNRGFKSQTTYLKKLCVFLYGQEDGNPVAVARELSIALRIPLEVRFVFKNKKEEMKSNKKRN